MNRFNKVTGIAESPMSVVWGKSVGTKAIAAGSFAALLLVSSITVGCSGSNDASKPSSASQIPLTPPQTVASSTSPNLAPPEISKHPVSKVQHKRPVNKSFTEKTHGVSFDYPRTYEMESGNKASDLLASGPMKSVPTSGSTVAAVQMPESAYPNTDFAGAFFGVSVNKDLSVEQCTGSPVQTEIKSEAGKTEGAIAEEAKTLEPKSDDKKLEGSKSETTPSVAVQNQQSLINTQLHVTENVSGEGAQQNDVKYFRTYQNGACYEFALNVTTVGNEDAAMKHVNRDRVFDKLEKILATVKIAPVAAEPTPAPQTTASIPAPAAITETPAQ